MDAWLAVGVSVGAVVLALVVWFLFIEAASVYKAACGEEEAERGSSSAVINTLEVGSLKAADVETVSLETSTLTTGGLVAQSGSVGCLTFNEGGATAPSLSVTTLAGSSLTLSAVLNAATLAITTSLSAASASVSGAVSALSASLGALSLTSLALSGTLTAPSATVTSVSANTSTIATLGATNVTVSGSLQAATLSLTTSLSAATLAVTNALSAATLSLTSLTTTSFSTSLLSLLSSGAPTATLSASSPATLVVAAANPQASTYTALQVGSTNALGGVRILGSGSGGVALSTDATSTGLSIWNGGNYANTPATLIPSTNGATLTTTSSIASSGTLSGTTVGVGSGSSIQTLSFDASGNGGINITNPVQSSTPYPLLDAVPGGGHRPNVVRLLNSVSPVFPPTFTAAAQTAQIASFAFTGVATYADMWHLQGSMSVTNGASGTTNMFFFLSTSNSTSGTPGTSTIGAPQIVAVPAGTNQIQFNLWWVAPTEQTVTTTLYLMGTTSSGSYGAFSAMTWISSTTAAMIGTYTSRF